MEEAKSDDLFGKDNELQVPTFKPVAMYLMRDAQGKSWRYLVCKPDSRCLRQAQEGRKSGVHTCVMVLASHSPVESSTAAPLSWGNSFGSTHVWQSPGGRPRTCRV
jgi:hypothetical protein